MLCRTVLNNVKNRSYASVVKVRSHKCDARVMEAVNSDAIHAEGKVTSNNVTSNEPVLSRSEFVNEQVEKSSSQYKQGDCTSKDSGNDKILFYVNNHGNDKFAHAILHKIAGRTVVPSPNCVTFKHYKDQSNYDFGFVLLTDQILPTDEDIEKCSFVSIVELHEHVKSRGVPNFWGARIPLSSQLHVDKWEEFLQGYWDKQLVHLLKFGFPVGFNRECP